MLTRLAVRDFALFESAELEFAPGLNVLTGETGAGKSLVVQALGLCFGARSDSAVVRRGARQAMVDAAFDAAALPASARQLLADAAIDVDDVVVLRRTIDRGGRSRSAVGGGAAPLAFLRQLGAELADIHGQHTQQRLLDERRHTELFDSASGLEPERSRVAAARQRLAEALDERSAARLRLRESTARRAELEERIRDIEAIAPRVGELDALRRDRERARQFDRIDTALGVAESLLLEDDGAAIERIGMVERRFADLAAVDRFFAEAGAELAEIRERLAELARRAETLRGSLDAEPDRAERLEQRIASLERLERVYGDLDAALAAAQAARRRLSELDRPGGLDALEASVKTADDTLRALAADLSAKRAKHAHRLERAISGELEALGFPRAAFGVRLERRPDSDDSMEMFGEVGRESVRFVITPNPGEGEHGLGRIASGGELARVMLAIRTALSGAGGAGVLIFDEIDAGIGGEVLDAVAHRLEQLAGSRQVICVTHQARIAGRAARHLHVHKVTREGRTKTGVVCLEGAARELELARMLGGRRPSRAVRAHARELLE